MVWGPPGEETHTCDTHLRDQGDDGFPSVATDDGHVDSGGVQILVRKSVKSD